MPDDYRFTTELSRLDVSKLDRAEAREVEGLYRTKEFLSTRVRNAAPRDSSAGPLPPDRLAGLEGAVADARAALGDSGYAVERIEVELQVDPGGAASADAPATVRLHLRPTDDRGDGPTDGDGENDRRSTPDDAVVSGSRAGRGGRGEVDVPDVTGDALDDATTTIEAAGFGVGEIDAETRAEPADAVVDQSPSAGETAPADARIDLTVSAGPSTEGEATTDDEGADDDRPAVRAVDGIGPTYADRLRGAGIDDLPTLLDRDVDRVAEITGAGPGRVEGWFDRARRLL